MPAKRTSTTNKISKQLSRTATTTSPLIQSLKIIFSIITVIMIIGLAIYCAVAFNHHNEAISAQKRIETYLENKYGQDFIVEKPVRTGYGFAVEGSLKATAYPVSNPDVRFDAVETTGYTRDKYISVLWDRDAQGYTAPFVYQVYGEGTKFYAEVSTPTGDEPFKVTSLKEALANSTVALTVSIRTNDPILTEDKHLIAEKVYSLGQTLNKSGVPIFYIYYYGGKESNLTYSQTKNGASAQNIDELVSNIKGVK